MTTSRYPSSADLRDFRARLMSAPSVARATPGSDWYRTWRTPDGWAMHPGTDTPSWPDERANGIGFRAADLHAFGHGWSFAARREAAAMRSRAFARSTTHPGRLGAFLCERADGCPDRPTLHHFR